jgi:hypothetical protein
MGSECGATAKTDAESAQTVNKLIANAQDKTAKNRGRPDSADRQTPFFILGTRILIIRISVSVHSQRGRVTPEEPSSVLLSIGRDGFRDPGKLEGQRDLRQKA